MHLRQPGFTYSACGPVTKNKERIKKFKETFKDKACFQHEMVDGDFKDLVRRTAADKVLCDKVFNIAKNLKCNGYQRGFAPMVYTLFDKKAFGATAKNEIMSNKKLAEE